METIVAFEVLLPLALILILSKTLSLGLRKLGMPQVIGMLIAGILLGLITFIPNQTVFSTSAVAGLTFIAEIGVILIMFSAGLETNIKQIKQSGFFVIIITLSGVIIPLLLGFLIAGVLPGGYGKDYLFRNLFYGVILTATSVSITVATLKELGKLNSKIGTIIISASILDDIIGIIFLSVIISLDQSFSGDAVNPAKEIGLVVLKTVLFFIFVIAVGLVVRYIFNKLSEKRDHHRRIPIFGIAFAFFLAYTAEAWFGIADITGAFFAGLMISGNKDTEYIERRTDIASYMIFTPVFFAMVGIKSMGSFGEINSQFILFGFLFIIAGIAGKLIGCGLATKACGYDFKDSFRCGVGMMARAEVCLIAASKGVSADIISGSIQPFILILILSTSLLTPLLLKQSYKDKKLALS